MFAAVYTTGEFTNYFSVEVVYNGFFCGLPEELDYVSASSAHFDNCTTDTWSLRWIDEMLRQLDKDRDERLHVYWLLPGKQIQNGLVLVDKQAHIAEMIKASRVHKTLVLFVDRTNFLQILRPELIVQLPGLPYVVSQNQVPAAAPACPIAEASSSCTVILEEQGTDQTSRREVSEAAQT